MNARIRQVLQDHARLTRDMSTLRDTDDLYSAGMTSHASVGVMLAIEDEFGIEFPEALLRKQTFASVRAIEEAVATITHAPDEISVTSP
jgi:acyl carrier protein